MNANVAQLVGRTLGQRYRLERTLGVGGMGAVFQATQLDLGRTVAVKVLLDVDPRGIARLRQEALTAGSLSCPHVVSIFDFQAPAGEPPFIVMEMLPGHSLAQLLQREPMLAAPRAARIAAQMLIGLEAAHGAGVVHRDVKPSNTWLVHGPGIEEHVKVLDCGIAKILGDGASLVTTTGSVLGTPAYLAPEQLRGLPVDERADIHAMGVVLYEMLAGRRPWQQPGPAVFAEILERVPTPLHEIAPHVPLPLSQIVSRALAKDPAARFPRAADMRAALEPFVGSPVSQPATVVGGLGAAMSAPPTAGYGVPSTVGMVAPTVDYAASTGRQTNPPYSAGPPMYAPTGSYAPLTPVAAAPPARSSSFALAFLLGGGFVVVAGGGAVAAFLIGRDHGSVAVADAGTAAAAPASAAAAAAGASGAAINPGSTAAIDGGARRTGGLAAAGASSARAPSPVSPGAATAGAAAAPVAAAGAISQRCECLTRFGGTLCTTTKVPNCGCHLANDLGSPICPQPFVGTSCPVRAAGDLLPYSAAGRKGGQPCSGFGLAPGNKSTPASGVTDCQFCYGRDKFAAVDGTACKGTSSLGDTVEGKWLCEK